MLKKIFFRYFLPAIIIFISSIFIFNAKFLSVGEISFINSKNIDTSFLYSILKESLDGKYIGLYSKKNFIFYPETYLEENLKKADKKIKSLKISYKGFSRDIEIDIEKKKEEFIFCTKNEKEKCFFMEESGKIFTEFKQLETETLKKDFLKFIEISKNKNIPEFILEEKGFKKVLELIKELKKTNLEIKKVEKRKFGEMVFYTKNNSKIVFQMNQDFSKIPETIEKLSIKKDLKISKTEKDFEKKIEYLNLSFGENIFYCLEGEECKSNY